MKRHLLTLLLLPSTVFGQDYLNQIVVKDLPTKTSEQLSLIRNEVYARHGHSFDSDSLRSYFSKKAWYSERVGFKVQFDSLTDRERETIKLINIFEAYRHSNESTIPWYKDPNTTRVKLEDGIYSNYCKNFGFNGLNLMDDSIALDKFGNPITKMFFTGCCGDTNSSPNNPNGLRRYYYEDFHATVWFHQINDIYIFTPKIKTNDGVSVGMPITILKTIFPDLKLTNEITGKVEVSRGCFQIYGYDQGIIKSIWFWTGEGM